MLQKPTRSIAALCGLLFLLPASARGAGEEHSHEITTNELMGHVKYLADDELQGRAAGSEGAIMAAAYIAAEYERLGLKPVGDNQSYYQSFSIPRGFKALPETSLVASRDRKTVEFDFGEDIYPLPNSAAGKAEGGVVFAGYGISAPDLNYDDYEGVDVKGKIVVVFRGLPNSKSKDNPFQGTSAARRYATLKSKQDTATAFGAAGLIVVNDPENFGSKSKDTLVTSGSRDQGKIPSLHMTYAAGRKLFSNSGVSLGQAQKIIDSRLTPHTTEVEGFTLSLNAALEVEKLLVRNVVGLLEAGAQDKKDETVVVGGHFDHVGLGYFGSLGGSKAQGQVHNGADDNASGTAGVMEIAGLLKHRVQELRRDVLFICFTAEEMGLLGSKHYVESPLVPLAKTAAMINLDMVSYLGITKELDIYGSGTSPSFEEMLERANRAFRIKNKMIEGPGSGRSDHAPFYDKGLPVLFFITGLHKNYHRPSDDWKAMDKRGFEKVVRMAGEIAFEIATMEKRPVFTPTSDRGVDSGPYLGISVENKEDGVYISDVVKGSPASKSGLKTDDRLMEVDDKEITNLSLFYGIWSGMRPGGRVAFLVRRSGRVKSLRVQLDK